MKNHGIVVAGAGRIGKPYIEILKNGIPGAELIGCHVPSGEESELVSSACGCDTFRCEDDYLSSPNVDAVVIATPSYTHEELAMRAMSAGKHILLEKPMALSLEAARSLANQARQYQRILMPSFPERFNPIYQKVRELLGEGVLGEIISINCKRRTKSDFRPSWYWNGKKSGGVIWDLACHDIDLCRWLLGQEVCKVAAVGKTAVKGSSALDNAFLQLGFSGGVLASLEASWTLPSAFPAWGDVRMDILGSEGLLSVDTGINQPLSLCGKGQTISFIHPADYSRWQSVDVIRDGYLKAMLTAFAEALSGEAPAPISETDGLRAVEVASAAHRSLSDARFVIIK